jgi:16S rRNA (guanine527-N7)-methyltransferase
MSGQSDNEVSDALASVADLVPRLDPRTLGVYLEELFRWTPQLGLVSKRDTPLVAVRLIRQSVALWDFVAETATPANQPIRRVVDIGSGAGFPGFVWAMLDPGLFVELVERKERKVAFLERVIVRTGLACVTATAADLRELARRGDRSRSFDLAVMMAVADPKDLAGHVERLLKTPGFFCVVRGRGQDDPGERLDRTGLHRVSALDTPGGRFLLYEVSPAA